MKAFLLTACMGLILSLNVQAQPAQDMGAMMAKMHGAQAALNQSCQMKTSEELARDKQSQQQDLLNKNQLSSTQFDANFAQGVQETRAQFAKYTPAQKTQACQELRAMQQRLKPVRSVR